MASKISATSGHNSIANTSPDDMLDCLITDLQSGQDAATLRAPPASSISMTTLSKESLIPTQVSPGRGHQEDDNQRTSVHLASTSVPSSEYSSSIYSKRSSALIDTESGQTTMSSFPADEILTPRPLNLSRATGTSADECRNAIATDTGSGDNDTHNSTVATFPAFQPPRSAVESDTSSDGDSDTLMKEIVKHPMVIASPTHGFIQTPSRLGHIVVNHKAARLLGLDGAGSPITPTTPVFHEVMRDITNREPMSSPHTLRNIASKLSLSGRKKSSQQEKEASALGKIEEQAPLKLSKMVEEADKLPEASGSMSRRRGFRPLSIHTGKAFDPFGFGASPKPDLKSAKSSENGLKVIEADFATLVSFTPPNIKHHPAFQSDPFTAKSPSPLLKTTSSPVQIRKRQDRMTPGDSSSNGSSGESMGSNGGSKKRFLFENGLRVAKKKDGEDPLDLMIGGSPLPRNRPFAPSRESLSTALLQSSETRTSASSGLSAAPLDSTRRNRGISSWFRQRDRSTERKSSGARRNSDGDAAREAQIAYLRKLFNAPSAAYDPDDPYPRHPNTGRRWNARNLKCTVCLDHPCFCCGRSCCTYRQACTALSSPLSTTQIKDQAFARMDRINRVFPHGREMPTFLQCTTGSGCGRYSCPECIGMCPLSICRDTQCKKCKTNPWAICDFHDDEQVQFCRAGTA